MYDATNTTRELTDRRVDTAIISVGATEQCGPCLPLHIDTLCAEYYARHWGKVLDAYVLPTLPFNTSEEHTAFKGTVSVSPVTLMTFVEEIVVGLKRQGFKKQVLTCGHGGSYWAQPFIKHVNHRYDDVILVSAHANSGRAWQEALQKAGLGERNEIHGGLTSLCLALYLCPDAVRPGEFGKEIPPELNAYIDYGTWQEVAPDGCWGFVTQDDRRDDLREKGKILLETFVHLQGAYLKEHLARAYRLKGV